MGETESAPHSHRWANGAAAAAKWAGAPTPAGRGPDTRPAPERTPARPPSRHPPGPRADTRRPAAPAPARPPVRHPPGRRGRQVGRRPHARRPRPRHPPGPRSDTRRAAAAAKWAGAPTPAGRGSDARRPAVRLLAPAPARRALLTDPPAHRDAPSTASAV